jgi:hypothetical protein
MCADVYFRFENKDIPILREEIKSQNIEIEALKREKVKLEKQNASLIEEQKSFKAFMKD